MKKLQERLKELQVEKEREKEKAGVDEEEERVIEAVEMLIKLQRGEKTRIAEIMKRLDELDPVVDFLTKKLEESKI
jgi:hypothetical protein